MGSFGRQVGRATLILVACILLAGCKVQLYSGLTQRDANEILAVLLNAGFDADTVPGKDSVTVQVEQSQIGAAIDLLNSRGLPRPAPVTLGDVFKQDGLISSPLEQRARFIYAVSEELSATLSQLDGVITARVHIVMPEARPNDTAPPPPSAAIFIKYRDDYDLNAYVPQIKQLVANSVQGLSYDKVSVVLFPSSARADARVRPPVSTTGFLADRTDILILIGGLALIVLALGGVIAFLLLGRRRGRAAPPATAAAE